MTRSTTVMIVAPTTLHRAAWQALLAAQPGLAVVGAVPTLGDAGFLAAAGPADAVFIDEPSLSLEAIQSCRTAAHPPGLLVLVVSYNVDGIVALIQHGATGCLTYDASVGELARALIAVGRGELVLPESLAATVLLHLARRPSHPVRRPDELSEREKDVLRLLAHGYTNKDIAQTLVLSVRTVESHLRTIYGKLGVRSRTDAALWAVRHGFGTDR